MRKKLILLALALASVVGALTIPGVPAAEAGKCFRVCCPNTGCFCCSQPCFVVCEQP